MANHNWITKCNQYVAHRDVKVTRRTAREEIDFGFETLKELQELETDEYFYSFDGCVCGDRIHSPRFVFVSYPYCDHPIHN